MVFRKKDAPYHLTKDEEFQLLKIILDKYLWIGTIALLYGLFLILNKNQDVTLGIISVLVGATIILLFTSVVSRALRYKKK